MRDKLWRLSEAASFLLRDMIRDGWRTGITLLNLLVFLCCYFCLASLAKAANEFGKQDRQDNTLLILSKNVFNPGDSSMKAEDFAPIHELEPQSVAAVAPLIYKLLRIDDYLIQVCGANAADYESVFGLKLSDGTWPSERGEVALSDGAVLLAHWKIGQTIMIYGKPFRISGTVTAAGNRTSSVWMPLAEAERLFNTHGVYQFAWIKVAPNADAGKVKQVLQADTRLNGRFDVFFVNALYQQYANALQDIKDISLVLMGFALVMVMVGTYGSVYLTLSERSREITILRAIGFSTNTLRGLLIFRSLLQVSVAFLLAWGTAEILLAHFEQISPLTINTLPLLVRIDIQVWGWGWLLSALCACLGVWLPTLRLHFLTVRESIQR